MRSNYCLLLFLLYFPITSAFAGNESLIVAGGCFWCVEADFEKLEGVTSAVSGYIGGSLANPTYAQVASGKTGHFEGVIINYDPGKISLRQLVDHFWKTIDPTDPNGQFCDKGSPYKTALFYRDEQQRQVFQQSLAEIDKSKPFEKPIVTQILPATEFYNAEDYHQDYYKKNPIRYNLYRTSCGRDSTIRKLWGEVVNNEL